MQREYARNACRVRARARQAEGDGNGDGEGGDGNGEGEGGAAATHDGRLRQHHTWSPHAGVLGLEQAVGVVASALVDAHVEGGTPDL